jgi:DNA-binding transcriptional LysR family regulator
MDFVILEEFVVYSKYLNLSKAAPRLHCSTATLSRHLKHLENEIGSDLFVYDNQTHRHDLTLVGTIVLEEANRMLSIRKSMMDRIHSLGIPVDRSITIAYQRPIDQSSTDLISLAQDSFQRQSDPLYINVYSERKPLKSVLFEEDCVDIVLLSDLTDVDKTEFTVTPVFEDSSVAIVSALSDFAKQGTVTIEQLSELDLVWASDDFSDYQQYVLSLFESCRRKPDVVMLKSDGLDYYFMKDMEGRFYVASKWHMDHYLNSIPLSVRKGIKVVEITGVDTKRHSFAVYRTDNPNPLVSAFVQAMSEVNLYEYY